MRNLLNIALLCASATFAMQAQAGDIKVLSAVVKDKNIGDAHITWQRNGSSSQQAITSSRGTAHVPDAVVDDADTTMIINKPGYSTLVVKCPCDNFTYALSPVMQSLDGLRAVLTWGASPRDLDSHLAFPGNHVYFSNKTGDAVNLDVDDTTSYGPETITIEQKYDGQRYVYAVHDYSNGSKKNSTAMSFSNARVEVYVGQTLIRTYRVKPDTTATSWVVFGIDEGGAFHDINQYLSLSRKGMQQHLHSLIAADSFEDHSLITPAIKKEAKRINTRGESLYHDKRLEDAMYTFQDAINLYPSYGQAYSNLGLTYQKLNRTAEALWANRKAIELASGKHKNRVQASSYYNIARIYEAKEQWRAALENFRKAKSLRQHSAYDNGIARMQEKLQ
ncbi:MULTISPECIES: tetratricopeptide repeat protein [Ferrimonas]|uniref:tetratricopeptide repeat protein n=1 Tax=Ferrimonas TaxID=44011 RepID=UPI000408F1C8|nr:MULTISPECIES: tetratricopeptide repeat protein [Ferrimonas]USD39121.1 tetratricopeptide repeat protein [Ferrimonas sp. SCSIO 43195]